MVAFGEIIGKDKIEYQLVCNAENFIEKAKDYGLEISNVPTLGGIMVWKKGSTLGSSDGAGHVGIVERIDSDNQIYTSESAYRGSAFFNSTRTNNNGRWGMGSAYSFRGCIVNPAVGKVVYEKPVNTSTNTGAIANIQETLNNRYGFGIAVDNIYGNQTKKALVKALQTELNKQFNARLAVDGIFGNATKSKCVNVKQGDRGNITWIIQAMLICKGYNLTADGIFGADTKAKVKAFQSANGLTSDGIVGKNTFEKLFK